MNKNNKENDETLKRELKKGLIDAFRPILEKKFVGESGKKINWQELIECECTCECDCVECACETGACPCDESTPSYSTYWGEEKNFGFYANQKTTGFVAAGAGEKIVGFANIHENDK